MGGSSGGGSTVDAAYNARMAALSEEEHAWAREYKNFYQFGNIEGYDPKQEIQGYYDPSGKFVEVDPTQTWQGIQAKAGDIMPGGLGGERFTEQGAAEWNQAMEKFPQESQVPAGADLITTTRGEVMDLGPSFMDMESAQIAANIKAIQPELDARLAELGTQQLTSEQARRLVTPGTDLALEQIGAERELIQPRTALTKSQYEAASQLLPGQTQLRQDLNVEAAENVALRKPVTSKFYEESLKGVDVGKRQDQAGAEVAGQFAGAEGQTARALSRYGGISPTSGRGRSEFSKVGLQRAGATVAARNRAQEVAEQENYGRLVTAVGKPTQPQQTIY